MLKGLGSLVLSILLLAGCTAEMRSLSAVETGCSPEEITIRDKQVQFSQNIWIAECRGKTYRCVQSKGGNKCQAVNL
jgi:hypothetical protein